LSHEFGLATEDDDFLPPSDSIAGQTSPPPAIGVIGTRPASSHKPITPKLNPAAPSHTPITPKLNPAAPAFKGFVIPSFSRSSKADKEKEKEKDKSKGKDKTTESTTSIDEHLRSSISSPAESRKSRDTHSIHTQNSLAESYESLEKFPSASTSDITPSNASAKEKDSSIVRQLLSRKHSSGKFSISSWSKKESGGLFSSGKKAGSSAANSDRNASVERDGSFDEYGEDAELSRSANSVTSSPMIGSTGSGEWKPKDSGTSKDGSRMSRNWGRNSFFKKGKGRESLDVTDRSEAEGTTEDEGVL